ncbi:MAG: hypothetical protein HOO04_08975, partial [Phycisphaerae bacterium]|nr:hypothetical protein [Phycisphaerae bacterium]
MSDTKPTHAEGVELPRPTSSPMVAAFGMTLLAAGIVTNWVVTVVGLIIMMTGIVVWFLETNPDSKELLSPLEAEGPDPILPRTARVAHLVSDADHRARIPIEIHPYSAGIKGGVIAGIAMAAFASVWGLIAHGSLWYTVNLLAGTMLSGYSDMTIDNLMAFHTEGLVVGIVIQVVMSLSVGILYGVTLPLIPRFQMLFSAIMVPAMWSGLMWGTISIVDPALQIHIEWIWFVASQVVFGLVAGWYILRTEKIKTMQNWHYLERIGVESPGVRGLGGEE